jgi:hypothetical protein
LVQGTLNLLILKMLVLHKLEQNGWISAEPSSVMAPGGVSNFIL